MPVTNSASGTCIDEVADGVYRIFTPLEIPGDRFGFSFNQYLVLDEDPLLYHTGPRRMFPLVREAVAAVMPVEKLKYVAFSHFEADECGSLNDWLALAPASTTLCGSIGAMTSAGDFSDRPPRAMNDGETLSLGKHTLRWMDTPHLPHGWDSGQFFDETTRTLFCGDLFTQPGTRHAPTTESDILGPSEKFRRALDYFANTKHTAVILDKLAATAPTTLACMHGSAWKGDGARLLKELAAAVAG